MANDSLTQMASELPETIEGCVSEIAKTSRRYQEYYDLSVKITELSIPRFNIILSLMDEMTAYCIAPDTVGEGFWEYREFIRSKEAEKYEMYGKELRYCYELEQDGSKAEMFKYVSGEEEGYPKYRYIIVPKEWLVCDLGDLKEKVLSQIFNDLSKHIYDLKESLKNRSCALEIVRDQLIRKI